MKEHDSEVRTEETSYPPSPRKINENILKAKLVAFDRNSIGSCYDNVLHQDDDESDGSVEETDLVHVYHDSDVDTCEGPVEEIKHDAIESLVDEESEFRARDTLKSIPANLVGV